MPTNGTVRCLRVKILFASILLCLLGLHVRAAANPQTSEQSSPGVDSIEKRIQPVLKSRCQSCHNSDLKLGGLALDSAAGLRRGGAAGPVVVPGDPDASSLYRRVARLEKPYMPLEADSLPEAEVALLKNWIDEGARWPESSKRSAKTTAPEREAVPEPEVADDAAAGNAFHTVIHPILTRCQSCHDEALKYSGLSLETPEGLRYGGLQGRAVIPGDPEASRLYRKAARLEPHFMGGDAVMLSDEEIAALKQWIKRGAIWPDHEAGTRRKLRVERVAKLRKLEEREITQSDRTWWSFQKPVRPAVPEVNHKNRVRNPIDAFVLAAQEAKGLKPAPLASSGTLMRRVYFDLTGLPPRPEEAKSFLDDDSPHAYEKLIDRLLESDRYGERWGRHWLDVVRYADSDGYEYDKLRPHSWRYRDYVIRAFNEDKPYDRFIVEQLAGDELPDRDFDSLTALGFCRNGPFIGDMAFMQNEQTRQDELDDIVTTTASAFLGLTVGCARCHHHKFDPIGQKDYYRLVSVFAPSVRKDIPLAPPRLGEEYDKTLREIDRRVETLKYQTYKLQEPTRRKLLEAKYLELPETLQAALKTDPDKRTEAQQLQAKEVQTTVTIEESALLEALPAEDREKTAELKAEIEKLEETRPTIPLAHAIADRGPVARPSYFLHRGSIQSKGSEVMPGTLAVLRLPGAEADFPKPEPSAHSTRRRLTLAGWIADPENPLTARVMVNRIWQHHFGRALVGTPNDFGSMGERPTHPRLLDWLATEFVRQGWSIKAMHRLILTSHTYRQDSVTDSPANRNIDPENLYLWRTRPRRLEGEAIRDSILAVSGALDLQAGGPGVFPEVDRGLIEGSPKGAGYQRWPVTKDGPEVWRRSIYTTQMRTITPPILDLFDPPDKLASCPKRTTTTVPTQALQLLNSPFVDRQAAIFADRVRNEAGRDPSRQIERTFLLSLSRPPGPAESLESLAFLRRQQSYHARHNQTLIEEGVDPAEIRPPTKAALVDLCHAMFNLSEFVYVN